MKCFYHDTRDAVGTCKSCGKGLCRDCAVDLERGLACRGRCESAVAEVIALIDQNVQSRHTVAAALGNMKSNAYVQAIILGVFGVFFIGTGLRFEYLLPYAGGLAAVFFAMSAFAAWRAVKLPR